MATQCLAESRYPQLPSGFSIVVDDVDGVRDEDLMVEEAQDAMEVQETMCECGSSHEPDREAMELAADARLCSERIRRIQEQAQYRKDEFAKLLEEHAQVVLRVKEMEQREHHQPQPLQPLAAIEPPQQQVIEQQLSQQLMSPQRVPPQRVPQQQMAQQPMSPQRVPQQQIPQQQVPQQQTPQQKSPQQWMLPQQQAPGQQVLAQQVAKQQTLQQQVPQQETPQQIQQPQQFPQAMAKPPQLEPAQIYQPPPQQDQNQMFKKTGGI